MQTIEPAAVEAALARLVGQTVRLHLETTAGAYTEGGYGVFIRNVPVRLQGAAVRGTGPAYRAGLRIDDGWVYAEGLTHWERDADGRVLMAGHDAVGRVTAICTVSPTPLDTEGEAKRIAVEPAVGAAAAAGPAAAVPGGAAAERSVVVALAHPDDETFSSGGTISLMTRAGVPVTLICATRGEQGRNMGNPSFANRETLRHLRERELVGACAELGIRDLRLLGCWDKTTEFLDPEALADRVEAVLREVRPSLVITSHPVHGGHPDHCSIGEATVRAVRRLPAGERPRLRCLARRDVGDALGRPIHTADVTAGFEAKMAALRAHRSQSEPMVDRLSAEDRQERLDRMKEERYIEMEP